MLKQNLWNNQQLTDKKFYFLCQYQLIQNFKPINIGVESNYILKFIMKILMESCKEIYIIKMIFRKIFFLLKLNPKMELIYNLL